jgi:hypothetical protein
MPTPTGLLADFSVRRSGGATCGQRAVDDQYDVCADASSIEDSLNVSIAALSSSWRGSAIEAEPTYSIKDRLSPLCT